ncbi:hypothetical protein HJFPF1_02006 [Paramyrothecium foliicola]|nr:hypothetical protein HJFPF1_02006 [Paramyrothecium foliicola]
MCTYTIYAGPAMGRTQPQGLLGPEDPAVPQECGGSLVLASESEDQPILSQASAKPYEASGYAKSTANPPPENDMGIR